MLGKVQSAIILATYANAIQLNSQLKWDEDISECIIEETVTLGLPSDTDTLVSDLSFLSTFGE
jgi:hypothetical protein